MATRIMLTEDEQLLYDEIRKSVNQLRENLKSQKLNYKDVIDIYAVMAQKAHELHMKLKTRDPKLEPKHHKYMLENRGVPVADPEFYNHIHPVEDLIAFIYVAQALFLVCLGLLFRIGPSSKYLRSNRAVMRSKRSSCFSSN